MSRAFLYAGQGSQHAGMGKDLYETFPEFREAFERASAQVKGFDLKTVCFEGPEEILHETRYTQPCMTAFAVSMTEVLKHKGILPQYTAGLSLGEYGALEAAGVLDFETTVRTVDFRGQAMAAASHGIDCGMTAILGLTEDRAAACCDRAKEVGRVSVCNLNCPGQVVIGGEAAAVSKASELAAEAGARRCIPLKVSGPFHTAFMKPAGDQLGAYFKELSFRTPECVVMYNVLGHENDARLNPDGREWSIPELLELQVQRPVRMEDCIRRMLTLGVDQFVEIGPGKTLAGFVRKTAKDMGISTYEVVSLETAEELERYHG